MLLFYWPNETGAPVEDLTDEMKELMDDLKNLLDRPEKVLMAAVFLHVKFENIHPFVNGNGRTDRLAMNYLLAIIILRLSSNRRIEKNILKLLKPGTPSRTLLR
mgnify:CR=1 FL=1